MEKIDLAKLDKVYFKAKPEPGLVTIGKAKFLSLQGKGDPSGPEFAARIQALYPVAYTIKFSFQERGRDFVISKLEALWWYDEKKFPGKTIATVTSVPRSEWEYRLLIRLPDFVTQRDVVSAADDVMSRKGLVLVRHIEFFEMEEGKCAQMLHVGPFSMEPESLQRLAEFMDLHKLERNGLHHEIYLSDFRKTDPAKLKTILREPVK